MTNQEHLEFMSNRFSGYSYPTGIVALLSYQLRPNVFIFVYLTRTHVTAPQKSMVRAVVVDELGDVLHESTNLVDRRVDFSRPVDHIHAVATLDWRPYD